ncbi:MAG: hypothetical protein FD171_1761 [Actinobacteria bacterium]|nr:MAG: hypothetical protein FD171_1761 [Actinomycetota bacterium]
MALPFDVRDLVSSGSRFLKDRDQLVRLSVVIEPDAADYLIDALRERLRPNTVGASLQVVVAGEEQAPNSTSGIDVVIAVAGSGGALLKSSLVPFRQARIPVVVVSLGNDTNRIALADGLPQPTADLIVGDTVAEVVDVKLAGWLADELASKRLALANNFAFVRRAVAEEAVRATAWQNGLVGAVAILPGADMPIMTANQVKMLMQIAAAFGQKLGPERIKELVAIVGGAFVMRTVARQALGFIPVLGWAVKGGIGYGGTVAMGMAAIAYFEQGADLTEVARKLKATAGDAVGRLPRRRKSLPVVLAPDVLEPLTLPGLAPGDDIGGPAGD